MYCTHAHSHTHTQALPCPPLLANNNTQMTPADDGAAPVVTAQGSSGLVPRLEAELAAKSARASAMRTELLALQTHDSGAMAEAEPKALDAEAASGKEALALLRELNRLIEQDTAAAGNLEAAAAVGR